MKHTFLNNNESEAFCWNNYRLFRTVAAPLWLTNTHFESLQEGDEPSLKILILILRQAPDSEQSSKYLRLTGNSSRQPNWKNQRQGRNAGSERESCLFRSSFVFKRNWPIFSHFSPFFLRWKCCTFPLWFRSAFWQESRGARRRVAASQLEATLLDRQYKKNLK